MIKGFVGDMARTLAACRDLVTDDGTLVIVVGNSIHGDQDGPVLIAADLLMSAAAECLGWTVQEIRVARYPKRRRINTAMLRESVVVLHPKG
jgi:hypothetical protein